MSRKLTLITNPKASSGLGVYVADALAAEGCGITRINPMVSRARKIWPVLRSIRFSRDAMWKARWENLVFSPGAWDRTTRHVGRQLERDGLLDYPILMVGKEYFPHPEFRRLNYGVFIHHNLRLALADGVTPWIPRRKDIPAFLERETCLYQHARRVFVGAQFVADNLMKEYGLPADRIVVAGGGPHPFFDGRPAPEVPEAFSRRIIFVGWDFGMKGGRDLLAAFERVRRQCPDIELIIAGPDESQWIKQDGVRWLGPIRSKDELVSLYHQSDLFVMPSLRDSFGFVFLEAMSQGVPCIGTNINAMPEIIEDGKSGYVVPVRNPDALASAILRYYAQPENRLRMGRAALARVHERYTWKRVASIVMDGMGLGL